MKKNTPDKTQIRHEWEQRNERLRDQRILGSSKEGQQITLPGKGKQRSLGKASCFIKSQNWARKMLTHIECDIMAGRWVSHLGWRCDSSTLSA